MAQNHDLHLISFDLCPYVERSRIVLAEKDVQYRQTFVELDDKPDWFLEISPRGKVPVLVVDDQPVFESNVINELIEELFPEPAMMPDEPIERAQARAWIVFNNDVLMSAAATLWFSKNASKIAEAKEKLDDGFERLERRLDEREHGPFFLGKDFSLVDAVYAPVFNRWEATEQMGFDDLLDGYPTVRRYKDALLAHPSVQQGRAKELTEKMLEYKK